MKTTKTKKNIQYKLNYNVIIHNGKMRLTFLCVPIIQMKIHEQGHSRAYYDSYVYGYQLRYSPSNYRCERKWRNKLGTKLF